MYSTKDGPGLRTTVFLCGCNLQCAWCANPDLIEAKPQVLYHGERCKQCGECVKHAANNSIELGSSGCIIDRKQCTNLEEMIDICPYDAYEMNAYYITSAELVDKLIRDIEFYQASKGGVTFSGGEAGLQKDFVVDCAKKLHEHGIHVALDTAGLLHKQDFSELLDNVDLVLFDLKAIDNEIHIHCTKRSNEKILENFKLMNDKKIESYVRMVVVPVWNDLLSDIESRLKFVKQYGSYVKRIDILKYHNLGSSKYQMIGKQYAIDSDIMVDDKTIDNINNLASGMNLEVHIEN